MDDIDASGPSHVKVTIARRLMVRLRRRSKTQRLQCQEMVELVTAYLEGALDSDMRTRFEQHLQQCDGCEEYLEQLRVTVHTVGTIRDEEIDPVFRSRLLEAFAETAGSW